MTKKQKKLLKKYLKRPYSVLLLPTKRKGKLWWMAKFPELNGIMSDGKTRKQALRWGLIALEDFLTVAVQKKDILKAVNKPHKENGL